MTYEYQDIGTCDKPLYEYHHGFRINKRKSHGKGTSNKGVNSFFLDEIKFVFGLVNV